VYAFLLPVGEGQDEGIKKKEFLFSTLTLALSRWERELLGIRRLKLGLVAWLDAPPS